MARNAIGPRICWSALCVRPFAVCGSGASNGRAQRFVRVYVCVCVCVCVFECVSVGGVEWLSASLDALLVGALRLVLGAMIGTRAPEVAIGTRALLCSALLKPRSFWLLLHRPFRRAVQSSGTQPMVLVSFVTLWPKNCDTLPLFLRDTFDAKMFRKWHPGKPNAKHTCQASSPVHYVQSYTYSRTQRTLLFLENVRTFPGNTTKFINSSESNQSNACE